MKKSKQFLWALVAMLIAVLTIVAMLSTSRDLSWSDLMAALASSKKGWLFLAIVCVAGYVFFEGLALMYLLRKNSYTTTIWQGVTYAAADIYCASITPSASGGQPVCGWFMHRDGIPGGFMSAILMMYLVTHALAALFTGLTGLFIDPSVFRGFSLFAKFLIILGYLAVLALSIFFILCLKLGNQFKKLSVKIINGLAKKNWVKRREYWIDRFDKLITDYMTSCSVMKGQFLALLAVFGLNVVQRFCQMLVCPLMYMATGGTLSHFGTVLTTQIFTMIGSLCVPIPGGMGVSDYLLYNGLSALMDSTGALQLELLSRSFSFYLCVLGCLVIVIVGYLFRRKQYATLRR
jgi:uncharacterized protein (TIRG00374 family)